MPKTPRIIISNNSFTDVDTIFRGHGFEGKLSVDSNKMVRVRTVVDLGERKLPIPDELMDAMVAQYKASIALGHEAALTEVSKLTSVKAFAEKHGFDAANFMAQVGGILLQFL